MVCSTCGYENQVGNRFCGMCGTPLPHRPLTAPGAQSTASLTRPLTENSLEPRAASSHTSLELESNPPSPKRSETSSNHTGAIGEPSRSGNLTLVPRETASDSPQQLKVAPPPVDLVPEIPLEEYVHNFRYVPPSDPEEITMRAETPVLEPERPSASNVASVTPVETTAASAETGPAPLADDVRERLGLEVDSAAEQPGDRPRFLDFNEPSTPSKPAVHSTPIAGPSFLGLDDVPQVQADAVDHLAAEEPSHGNWRIWLVVIVVVVFGLLGVLEWRAQVRQTNSGPVEVIRMKMRSLIHGKAAESVSTEPSPPAASPDSSSKPEMQVEPPAQPQNQNPPANTPAAGQTTGAASAPNAGAAATSPGASAPVTPSPTGNQPVAGQSSATPLQKSAPNEAQTNVVTNPSAKSTATTNSVDNSKLTPSQPAGPAAAPAARKVKTAPPKATDDDEEVVVRQIVPGADEMAKANNASDSAAEAAWLWKATAKGNPTAPVRLADMYIKGDGVPRSCEQAVVLLKTAAAKENALARNRLASMYGSGTCVQRNRVEAYRWFSSALTADPNSQWSQQHRDQLWQQMTPEERTLAQKYR